MIQASELRIGNFVYRTGMMYGKKWYHQIKVESICEDGISVEYAGWGGEDPQNIRAGFKNEELEGIPLTPELLEKCGFIEYRPGEWSDKDFFYLNKEGDGFAVFASEWTIGKPLKYLHQLQNSYFCLEEKELQVNL